MTRVICHHKLPALSRLLIPGARVLGLLTVTWNICVLHQSRKCDLQLHQMSQGVIPNTVTKIRNFTFKSFQLIQFKGPLDV